MKKTLYLLLITLIVFSYTSYSQLVSGNAFLKGQFVEVGIDNTGAFGTDVDAPAGYHPRGGPFGGFANMLGFVADPAQDGWNVGTPDYMGDYFMPGGVPHEGWSIQIGTTWNSAWRSTAGGAFATESGPLLLTGANVSYYTEFSKIISEWQGTMGNLAITQKTVVDTNKLYFVIEVTLKNNGTTDITDIYYERTVDPENEEEAIGGSSILNRTVVFQPTGLPGDDDKCLVKAVGLNYPTLSYMGLGTVDCRAKAFVMPSAHYYPHYSLDMLYDETYPGAMLYAEGATTTANTGVGIVYDIGTIAAGDSTTLSYAYILHEAQLDSAFNTLASNWNVNGGLFVNGDTITICRGVDLEVNITGGGNYVWGDWTPNSHLEYTSGRENIIHVDNTMTTTTYTVIGTTTICPQSDTLTITVIPVGDTTSFTEEICAGEVYNFDGTLLYNTGTYYRTYSSALMGCDSVRELHLTVNPLPNVEVYAPETDICEGDDALIQITTPSSNTNYQWYRNDVGISGATDNQYIANTAGEYRVIGITNKGCTDTSRRVSIIVNPVASANILDVDYGKVCIGDTLKFEAALFQNHEYRWSPEKYFRYTSGFKMPTAYGIIDDENAIITLMTLNQFGCKAYDSVNIIAVPCCEALLPTVFSPNGDGKNDNFNIKLLNNQKVVSFQIFNRRGNLVYNNNDPKNGWNGFIENTGEAAQQATYFYRIVYTCTDGANYEAKGDITLMR